MSLVDSREARLALALLLGLLVGVERERRKKERGHDSIAGLRTFGLTGFLGGLAAYLALPYGVVAGAVMVAMMVIVGYALDPDRSRDRGLTTEVALVITYLLGALALERPAVAAAGAFGATLILSMRTTLHRFVREIITEEELHDALLVLIFAFVVLPLAPDTDMGPYDAINPQSIARVVLVVLGIGASGYVAQRVLGQRYGLLIAGFAAGFVSSSATIASMGLRAKADPAHRNAAVAGGLASSVATVAFYAVIIVALDTTLLLRLALPLGLAGLAAALGTIAFARADTSLTIDSPKGRAFQWLPSLLVGGASALLAVIGAALGDTLGHASVVVVSGVAGLVDAHATSASVATLHRSGRLDTDAAMLSVVVALSANTLTKIVMAGLSRDRAYTLRLAGGVLAIALGAWLGLGVMLYGAG